MKNRNSFFEILYGWLGTPFVLGYWILGGISYIWSVIIAGTESGFIAAGATFIMPIVGQLFWTFKMWQLHSFEHNFVLVSLGAFICFIISTIFVRLSANYAESQEN